MFYFNDWRWRRWHCMKPQGRLAAPLIAWRLCAPHTSHTWAARPWTQSVNFKKVFVVCVVININEKNYISTLKSSTTVPNMWGNVNCWASTIKYILKLCRWWVIYPNSHLSACCQGFCIWGSAAYLLLVVGTSVS